MVTYKKTRTRRHNPLFDYKAFVSKRKKYKTLLAAYLANPRDEVSKDALKELLSPYTDAFSLLKYSTPFSVRALIKGFSNALGLDEEVDLEKSIIANNLARELLGIDFTKTDLEIYIDWFVDQTINMYGLVKSPDELSKALNEFVEEYNDCCPNEKLMFEFENPSENEYKFRSNLKMALLKHARSEHKHPFEMCANHDDKLRFIDERVKEPIVITTKLGFLGALAVFFFRDHLDDETSAFNLNEFVSVERCFTDDQDIRDRDLDESLSTLNKHLHHRRCPFWLSAFVESIDFFNVGIHFTKETFESGVTPTNLRTKLADYTQGSVATFGKNIPTVTKESSSKALIHFWHIEIVEQQTHYETETLEHYGNNMFFIFTNAILNFYKPLDKDHESACLLQDVVEVIPFYAEINDDDPKAYFGLSPDGTMALFEVDFTDWIPEYTHFGNFVYIALCEYLRGPDYRIEHNINQTINP